MKRLRSWLIIVFIFVCGFLVGGFLGAAVGWVGLFHKIVKGGPGFVRETIVRRANDDLRLKPEQRAAVKKIVDETAIELGSATVEVRPHIAEILGRAEERIRVVLDAQQRQKFDGFANKGRRRWKSVEKPPSLESTAPPAPAEDSTPVPVEASAPEL